MSCWRCDRIEIITVLHYRQLMTSDLAGLGGSGAP